MFLSSVDPHKQGNLWDQISNTLLYFLGYPRGPYAYSPGSLLAKYSMLKRANSYWACPNPVPFYFAELVSIWTKLSIFSNNLISHDTYILYVIVWVSISGWLCLLEVFVPSVGILQARDGVAELWVSRIYLKCFQLFSFSFYYASVKFTKKMWKIKIKSCELYVSSILL